MAFVILLINSINLLYLFLVILQYPLNLDLNSTNCHLFYLRCLLRYPFLLFLLLRC